VPFSAEVYTGAELRTPVRSGALDAYALPSLFLGRRHMPPQRQAPAPVAKVVHTSGRAGAHTEDGALYAPRPGSVPSQVLAHLRLHGGHLTYADLSKRFSLPASSVTAVFKPALRAGVLKRHLVNERAVLALPAYVPPPSVPRPSKQLSRLQARLQLSKDKLAAAQAEVRELESRVLRTPATF
jgi:hypothetical protein